MKSLSLLFISLFYMAYVHAADEPVITHPITMNKTAKSVWQDTVTFSEKTTVPLKIKVLPNYKLGESLQAEITIPYDGYLNVISIGPEDSPVLLFPNKFSKNNFVKAGTLTIPQAGQFIIKAHPPMGEHLIAAILTNGSENLRKDNLASGEKKDSPVLAEVKPSTMRGLIRRQDNTLAAQANHTPDLPRQDNTSTTNINTVRPEEKPVITKSDKYAAGYQIIQVGQ